MNGRQRNGSAILPVMMLLLGAIVTAAAFAQDGTQKPRALLLQQASSNDYIRTMAALEAAGFQATWLNKDTIDRMPSTAEGIRNEYDTVFFGSLALEGGLNKVLSPEQLEALKTFVHEGGGLVTVIGEAGKDFADLLPITSGSGAGPMEIRPEVIKPEHPAVLGLPQTWAVFGSRYNSFSKVQAKPGATVLMEVPAKYVGQSYPFLIAGEYGEGRVVCLNSLWAFSTGMRFKNWDWAPACFAQMGRWAAKLPPVPAANIAPLADPLWFWAHDRKTIPGVPELLDKPVITLDEPIQETRTVRLEPRIEARLEETTKPPVIEEGNGALRVTFANGIVARIDKRGMVGYQTADGTVLARDPVSETPHIMFSGATVPQITKPRDGEPEILQETLPDPKAPPQAFSFVGFEVEGAGVTVRFRALVEGQDEGELAWSFIPRVQSVDGVHWAGVGEKMVLDVPRLHVEQVTPRHRWAPGGNVDGCYTFRTGCYSVPRGYGETHFSDATTQDAGHFRWFSSGQPFQMLGSPAGTLWCYTEDPALIASWLCNQAGAGHIQMINQLKVGRVRGKISTPTLWYMFSASEMDHNLWMSAYDFVRNDFRGRYGIKTVHPQPSGMARFDTMGFTDLRRYADAMVPLLKRLGLKRIDCGVRYVNEEMHPEHGGPEALKYLCDKAHDAGIEVFIYSGVNWSKDSFEPLKQHPEWIVRDRAGKWLPTGYEKLWAFSLRSGWWDFSLDRYEKMRSETGVDGVWLDSWTMPNEYVNFAEENATPTVGEALEYLKALQDRGIKAWVEGQSPAGLDSFWYRQEKYGDLKGNEFCLTNTSPFAYAGNGVFYLDLFRLLSYNCAMLQDPRVLYDADDPITQVATQTNRAMNRVHETVGFPTRVREIEGGTFWECENGWAVFGHQSGPVEVLLPAGDYEVEAIDSDEQFTLGKMANGEVKVTGLLKSRSVLVMWEK